MAKLFNRAKMTTASTGSGTVNLSAASVGFQTFAAAGVSNGDVVQYVIEQSSTGDFEIGTGTFSASGNSLTRSVSESSNSNNPVSLDGTATVSITAVSDDLNRLQHGGSDKVTVSSTGASVTGNLAVTGTVDGVDVNAFKAAYDSHNHDSNYVNVNSSGNVGIGMAPDSAVKLSVSGAVGPTNGSNSAPTHTFYGDPDTGMYRAGANTLAFSTGGTERMRLESSGAVIRLGGTTNAGYVDFNSTTLQLTTQRNPESGSFTNTGRAHAAIDLFDGNGTAASSYIRFNTASANNTVATERMRVSADGNVGIGTSSPSSFNTTGGKFVVAGGTVQALFSDAVNYTLGIKHQGSGAVGMFGGTAGSSLALMSDNTERMRLTAAGNLGIGVTPQTDWTSTITALQIGPQSVFRAGATEYTDATVMGTNVKQVSATNKYIETGAATEYLQQGGSHFWNYAASGTAGNTISFSEAMRIDSSGKLLVGTATADSGTLVTVGGAATFTGQNTAHGASRIKIGQDTSAISQIRFYGADTSTAGILQFTGSSSDSSVGGERMRISSAGDVELIQGKNLYWKHQGGGTIRAGITADSSDNLTFSTGSSDTTRMTIDTNGRVGITAAPEFSAVFKALELGPTALVSANNTNGRMVTNVYYDGNYKRKTDGVSLQYEQDNAGHIWYFDASGTADAAFTQSEVARLNTSGHFYLSGGGNVVLLNGAGIDFSATSGTGTSELLDDYEEGTWSPEVFYQNTTDQANATNNVQSGKYIKIGALVFVEFRLDFSQSSSSPAADNIGVKNLPFAGAHNHYGATGNLITDTTVTGLNFQLPSAGGTTVVIADSANGGNYGDNFGSGGFIRGSFTYLTA